MKPTQGEDSTFRCKRRFHFQENSNEAQREGLRRLIIDVAEVALLEMTDVRHDLGGCQHSGVRADVRVEQVACHWID